MSLSATSARSVCIISRSAAISSLSCCASGAAAATSARTRSTAASGSSGTATSIAASTQHAVSAFFGQRIGSARTSVFFSLSAVSSR